ncbi:MAG TPA: neutral/alkaline non-lysosomal ceramidase N-terminal domain-containing protein [Candidatus Hydrogenedentes bacterium]|nr:neutral/alkaline non-lysosomal ceramidase N-terminal domain-containing protein [Candidatus Hydrogenedentota bacterium]
MNRRDFLRRMTVAGVGGMMAATAGHAASASFRAGIGRRDITPPMGVSLAGHTTDRKARSVHDPLHACCIAMESGNTRAAVVTVDLCMVPRDVFDAARRLVVERCGIPPEHLMMSATHTHTGPAVTPLFQSDPDPAYVAALPGCIADAVEQAVRALEPAAFAFGSGTVPDEVFNRRWFVTPALLRPDPFGNTVDRVRMNPPQGDRGLVCPAGPTDPEVVVWGFRRADGSPLALLACYALHYVGGVEDGAVSADYFGRFRAMVEETLARESGGRPVLAMLANGASGDINNINWPGQPVRYQPYEKMESVARKVADEALRVYGSAGWQEQVPRVRGRMVEIEAGVRLPRPDEVDRARAMLAQVGEGPLKTWEEIYARETVLLADYPGKVRVPLYVLGIGDACAVGLPCEAFCRIGLTIKRASPCAGTMVIGLANGYYGYLPTTEQHLLGGYETWRARSSYLAPDTDESVLRAVLPLLNDMAADDH